MNFTINIAKAVKKVSEPKPAKISRLCLGVVTLTENGEYRISIDTKNDPNYPENIIIPFTDKSFDLRGRKIFFSKEKDEYGHYTRYIRDEYSKLPFEHSTRFDTITPKEICSGHIVSDHGVMKFELSNVHGKGKYVFDLPTRLNEKEPLFK